MKYVLNILNWINRSWPNRICTVALFGLLTFSLTKIFEAKSGKKEDCTYYVEQNKQLIDALIDIKKDLQAGVTSYHLQPELIMFASFDTIPKRKRMNQYQQAQQRVIYKIDSILYRIKQDSVKQKSKS